MPGANPRTVPGAILGTFPGSFLASFLMNFSAPFCLESRAFRLTKTGDERSCLPGNRGRHAAKRCESITDLVNALKVVETFDLNALDLRHRDVRVEQALVNKARRHGSRAKVRVTSIVLVTYACGYLGAHPFRTTR